MLWNSFFINHSCLQASSSYFTQGNIILKDYILVINSPEEADIGNYLYSSFSRLIYKFILIQLQLFQVYIRPYQRNFYTVTDWTLSSPNVSTTCEVFSFFFWDQKSFSIKFLLFFVFPNCSEFYCLGGGGNRSTISLTMMLFLSLSLSFPDII